MGFQIIIFTSRNMRSYKGNIDLIKLKTLPVIVKWLKKYSVPYDEIIIGVDEAGRGPLFGPVYTGAVILPREEISDFDRTQLKDSKKSVIALGGGSFENDKTRSLVLKENFSLWLKCNLNTLSYRCSNLC